MQLLNHGNDSRYFDAFKKVRNRIRNYDAGAIALQCLDRLHAPNADEVDNMRRQPPWILLLLLKWTIQYGDFTSYGKKILLEPDLNSLINLMHDVSNAAPLPRETDHPLVLVRPLGYQQFWHQQPPQHISLARQGLLFGKLDPSHTFRRWFQEETMISVDDFIDLSVMIFSMFQQPNVHSITLDSFSAVAHSFPANCISQLLSAISRTPAQLREYLTTLHEERRANELYERTPLVRYPLLKLGNQHLYYTRNVLMHSLSDFIYDTLRRRDAGKFMNAFGPMFERYVRTAIESTAIAFRDEESIRRMVGRDSQVVDFLIVESDVNVFIDAKGVEVGLEGMTSYRPGDVTNAMKSSVVKGITQGMNVVRSLRKLQCLPEVDFTRSRNFLLVVTFKDLFLGTGQEFYESYAKSRLDSALQGDLQDAPIPLENVFIISIDEFDYLISCAVSSRLSFAQILRPTQERGANPDTKRLMLIQYLQDMCGDVPVAAYLKAELDHRVEAMRPRFRE
jgi:hypothetical protein